MKRAFENSTLPLLTSETLAEIIALKQNSFLDKEELQSESEQILEAAKDYTFHYLSDMFGGLPLSEITKKDSLFHSMVKEFLLCQACSKPLPESAKDKALDFSLPVCGHHIN